MNSLQNRLYEGFYKNAGGMVRPSTKDELIREIENRFSKGQTNLNDIDTSKITDMSFLFSIDNFSNLPYNFDVSSWDVSNVKYMNGLFEDCRHFNCDLSRWNVSKVRDMSYMFSDCSKFSCDLSKWNVSKVIHMNGMFNNSGMWKLPRWYKEH